MHFTTTGRPYTSSCTDWNFFIRTCFYSRVHISAMRLLAVTVIEKRVLKTIVRGNNKLSKLIIDKTWKEFILEISTFSTHLFCGFLKLLFLLKYQCNIYQQTITIGSWVGLQQTKYLIRPQ